MEHLFLALAAAALAGKVAVTFTTIRKRHYI